MAQLPRAGRPTARRVFARYLERQTPKKRNANTKKEDRRRAGFWTRVLGPDKDLEKITGSEWEEAIHLRRTGGIDAHGNPVPEDRRKPVRQRAVEADCHWLRSVINWAEAHEIEPDLYLMNVNPIKSKRLTVEDEKNPRRPFASTARFEKVRAKADQVMMEVRWDRKRRKRQSFLGHLFDIVHWHGRRISHICGLKKSDLILDHEFYEHGAIRWPKQIDKQQVEVEVPMSQELRHVIDRIMIDHRLLDESLRDRETEYLFASPTNPARPISKDLASAWLEQAEALAGLPKLDGSLWHAYRRKWVTQRKHLPDADVAECGGWRGTETLKECYQMPDPDTMQSVIEGARNLGRER